MDPSTLRGLGPFTDLDEVTLERLAPRLSVRDVPPGADLTSQGEPVEHVMVVLRGEADVTQQIGGLSRDTAVLRRGAMIGEVSLVEESTLASATVTATTDVEVVVPDGDGRWLLDEPVVGQRLRDAARRRRATNHVMRLGPVTASLADGTQIELRPLWPDDWRLLEIGAARISRQSLYQRFFSIPKLTEHVLRRLATVDFVDDFAWVALDPVAEQARGATAGDGLLGVGRLARDTVHRDRAEIALIVADHMQGRGVGRLLLAALAVAADVRGITLLDAEALATNTAIRGLLSSVGARWEHRGDAAQVQTTVPVAAVLDTVTADRDLARMRTLVQEAEL